MTKYTPLYEYLAAQPLKNRELTLSLTQIEQLLGSSLPASAYKYREWWQNEYRQSRHVQARAWLKAGWKVDTVDQAANWVRFTRC